MNAASERGLLAMPPGNLIAGRHMLLTAPGSPVEGEDVVSSDPARPRTTVWSARATVAHVDVAVSVARKSLARWRASGTAGRTFALESWRSAAITHAERLAALITLETGKTLSESRLEAKAVAEKVSITLDAQVSARVAGFDFEVSPTRRGVCEFAPHGVVAVIGPFNFPAHLPNGHIVPALLAGNTVVFKPSERAPAVGQFLGELAQIAGIPAGVFNVVQGAGRVASALAAHHDIDGVLFTGSWSVGRKILEANLDSPGRMVALEMGGSNASIVLDDCHMTQAVVECVRSAFATAGQRCTCTRRIIILPEIASEFIALFCKLAAGLSIGPGDSADPVFMGPLISKSARDAALAFQARRCQAGAEVLLESKPLDREGWFLTPGVIQVERFDALTDEEVFGPIVQVSVARDLDDAIDQANATEYGLAAAVYTASRTKWDATRLRLRAGCVNWNVSTAGASSRLPFGGLGKSGNLRPAGAFSVDYCAAPVARLEESSDLVVFPDGMRPL
ncbi:MAG: aldehyde dehydrogenase family protein [Phycisphaerales bacterium]|nr:aldehyde dehydrogenase family protein [Phycisphaerales bacterium]